MTSTDEQLLQDFFRIRVIADRAVLEVACLSWEGPHTPITTWETVEELRSGMDAQARARAALEDERWFGVCTLCGERNPNGWLMTLDDECICHRCAERHRQIVF
ncbi:hypothetical protein E5F05_20575 [Deinococcus metallilatus]|uniref:DksA C4-type domain-containing protein n=1 Tax=Deinococcus metallilatus TaxID=1211322 RepID=A0AAJ5JX13_9DEIO|nr:hypothetical protein [Deinococcus metallilatus]MBB5297350.1 hypothetical protein [Deinococcus metallilatus]QBY10127.1 hypothetical protein E5F05_20575 [Deinococcus metallilatus]RXJ08287.1 hypothetical protein ERJ73_19415 [Deinococcus metallilatus]TLK21194.1 hypothetical protein FCS05_19450 [Deinococcus metallilatus]GMA17085.1 hypothetical protein GCM10025871_34160 [Deinococcus metallilatus]